MRLGLLVCYGNFLLLLLFEDMFYPLRNYYANTFSSFSKFVFSLLISVSFSN